MIDPAGIPIINGDMNALAQHAGDLMAVGAQFADTGERVHTGWQALAPAYLAPEAGQLLAATGPVQQVSASVGEDIGIVGRALADYAEQVRDIQLRLDRLRTDASALVGAVGGGEPSAEQVEQSNGLLAAVNGAVAEFDEAQRRCANTINGLFGGVTYRADDGDGVVEVGEYGYTAQSLDAAARSGGVAWGSVAAPPEDDGDFWSDLGHGALDVIGLVPVVGEVADLANAAWYAAEGDYLNAGLSAAGAIPFVGWAATGGKLGINGVKAVTSANGARAFWNGRPTMVPANARKIPFTPDAKFPTGIKYQWTGPGSRPGQPSTFTLHGHGVDKGPDAGPNASSGPVYRVQEELTNPNRTYYHDGAGNSYRSPQAFNPNSPSYVPNAANDTHIPYPKDQPPPDRNWHRVAVSNPAPLFGPEPGQGE